MKNKIIKGSFGFLFLIAIVYSCKSSKEAVTETKKEVIGINTNYMDKSVSPADDFFRYVNGKWLDNTEIPADRTRWGSFDELRKNTDDDVMAIVKIALQDKSITDNSDQGKALNLYRSIIDTVARNKAGVEPIMPYINEIDNIKNLNDLFSLIEKYDATLNLGFLGTYVYTDAKDSNKNVVYLGTGSLGLPDRDYYVSDAEDMKEKKEKYLSHVANMLHFIEKGNTKLMAKTIVELETEMASSMLTRVERRDRRNTYNPMAISQLNELAPSIKWEKHLEKIGFANLDSIVVSQPKYISKLQDIFSEGNIDAWKNYMKWTLLRSSSDELSTEIEKENWQFYGKTLRGAVAQRPLEERALAKVNGLVGEALGKLYVAQKFPPEAKAKAQAMISNVMLAFENRIDRLPWMTKATKENAKNKLNKLTVKIGYPDKWKDYSKLQVIAPENGGSWFQNSMLYSEWNSQRNREKLGKPVDKTEWGMSPQTVNAYFNPSNNEIVFPAAILQPPFYDYRADEAVNYGGIGAVIGHEISHAFDDSVRVTTPKETW